MELEGIRGGLAGEHLIPWKFQDCGGRLGGLWVRSAWWLMRMLSLWSCLFSLALGLSLQCASKASICGMPWATGFSGLRLSTLQNHSISLPQSAASTPERSLSGILESYMSKMRRIDQEPLELERWHLHIQFIYLFIFDLIVALRLGKTVIEIGL